MVDETDPVTNGEAEESTSADSPQQDSVQDEHAAEQDVSVAATAPEVDTSTDTKPTNSTATSDEPLPEWEELTPELFEDECLRGDFMLRWAAILLAVLFGCVYITHSSVLLETKTGEFIRSHGLMPPRSDPFAVSTEGRTWVNLHWLADSVLSVAHQLGGFEALSILTALKLGLSFWLLSRIQFFNVTTWWNSVCAAIALVAVFPAIQPGQMSTTILGLSVLMWLLHVWRTNPDSSAQWGLVALFVLWANADARAWVGLALFAVFFLFDVLRRTANRKQLIIGGAALAGGILVNPFPGQPIFAFQHSMAIAERAKAEFFGDGLFPQYAWGMMTPEFWTVPNAFSIAAAVLLGLSFVGLFLNANRFDWSMTFAWMGMNGLSFYFGELIPYAAIVNYSVAATQTLDWYRESYPTSYEVKTFPVLFARAGRAITVLSLFAVAYTAINGLLMGENSRRVGLGLDPRLANRLESMESDVLPGIFGDAVMNLRTDQGDMLIWFGKRPFLDSRIALHALQGENHFELHQAALKDLLQGGVAADEEKQVSWQDVFEQANIQSIVLPLGGPSPAYNSFVVMAAGRGWPMTGFGSEGAVFVTPADTDPELVAHIEEQATVRFSHQAYSLDGPTRALEDTPPIWPRTVSEYDRWLVQKIDVTENRIQLAQHYIAIASQLQQALTLEQSMALAVLAMRNVSAGLAETPDDPQAYRILADAQLLLEQAERAFLQAMNTNYLLTFRKQVAVSYMFHAAQASGGQPFDLRQLFVHLVDQQNLDMARLVAGRYYATTGRPINVVEGMDEEALAAAQQLIDQIDAAIAETTKRVSEARTAQTPLDQLVAMAINGGCPVMAIGLIEEDLTKIAPDPSLQLTYALLLLRVGRSEDAWEQLEGMQAMVEQFGTQNPSFSTRWRQANMLANLVANERTRAATLMAEDAVMQNELNVRSLIIQPPAASAPMPSQDVWSAVTLRMAANALISFPEVWAGAQLQSGLILIEKGDLKGAKSALESILEIHPEFSMRPLVVLYLRLMTQEEIEFEPPSQWIPVWDGMFAPDEIEAFGSPSSTEETSKPQTPPEQSPAVNTPRGRAVGEQAGSTSSRRPPPPSPAQRKANSP